MSTSTERCIVLGPPGSGKTTWIEREFERRRTFGDQAIVVDLDPGALSLTGIAVIGVIREAPLRPKSSWEAGRQFVDGMSIPLIARRYETCVERVRQSLQTDADASWLIDMSGFVFGDAASATIASVLQIMKPDRIVIFRCQPEEVPALRNYPGRVEQSGETSQPKRLNLASIREKHRLSICQEFRRTRVFTLSMDSLALDIPDYARPEASKGWYVCGLQRQDDSCAGRALLDAAALRTDARRLRIRCVEERLAQAVSVRVGTTHVGRGFAASEALTPEATASLAQNYA